MAALMRNVFTKAVPTCRVILCNKDVSVRIGRRSIAKWMRPYLYEVYKRRVEAGPDPLKHRSEKLNWNYSAELFAFGKRLGEEFNEDTLRRAFTHRSYIENEELKRKELGMDETVASLELEDNTSLVEEGRKLSTSYIKAYLRAHYPRLPEEGISAICDYLLSEELLCEVGSNLGLQDLILCQDFPPEPHTLSTTLLGVIGALAHDQGPKQAEQFIQDFIAVMLVDKDINNLFEIPNPMGVLSDILTQQGQCEPEPRLLNHAGRGTVVAAYVVGIYSNKQLIGQAPGETVSIAEEMAARDALKNIFGTADNRPPLALGNAGRELHIAPEYLQPNPSIQSISLNRIQ